MKLSTYIQPIVQFLRDGIEAVSYWLQYRTIRPKDRRFFYLNVGQTYELLFRILGALLPAKLQHKLLVAAIRHSKLFDAEYYLKINSDVKSAGLDPAYHYVRYGDAEGRCPNPLFDPRFYRSKALINARDCNSLLHYCLVGRYKNLSPSAWFDAQYYIAHNRDVERRGFDPLMHYLRWGGREGRSPNPSFDGGFYLRTYPDVAAANVNPLIHYILCGRLEGRATRMVQVDDVDGNNAVIPIIDDRGCSPGAWGDLQCKVVGNEREPAIAVVIPVYRDRKLTWRCLDSVLSSPCSAPFRIIVIDDASPEADLSKDLDEMARRGWISLHRNEYNLGFVASVNHGIKLAGSLDVVLLNADTEVYPGWLDRLVEAAWRNTKTASVTPLSNNATIASYPRFLLDNPYPLETDYATLDQLAAKINAGIEVEAPTGVGFCMYLRRDAIDQVGLFDEKAFNRGYGEENDWCQRAVALGLRNIIAPNIFVRHFGGASFQEQTARLIAHAMKKIDELHPKYHQSVQAFIQQDPLFASRERLDWARLKNQVRNENVLIVCHSRGGGTERHVQEDTQRLISEGKGVFYLRPVRGRPSHVRFSHPRCRQLIQAPTYAVADTKALAKALKELNITTIHLHGLVDMVPEAAEHILTVARQLQVPLDVDIHDYKVICPRINLVDQNGFYCGEPDEKSCDTCLDMHGNDFGVRKIKPWRKMHYRVLRYARNVWAPDQDVAQRLARYFPDIVTQVLPHEHIDRNDLKVKKTRVQGKVLHVLIIGAISKIKGYDALLACAKEARHRRIPVRFSLLGYSMNDAILEAAGIEILGRYQEHEAEDRLRTADPDIVWIPSTWPETFCYTLSIALKAGYPTCVFDIGAQAARLRQLGLDRWILPLDFAHSPSATLAALVACANEEQQPQLSVALAS